MEYLPREQVINQLQQPFQSYINQYGIDDIGIFEEEGQENQYHIGYNVKKSGKTYHIHMPFQKNNNGDLAPLKEGWTLETDEPQNKDRKPFQDIEAVFREI